MRSTFFYKGILFLLCFCKTIFLFAQDGIIKGRVYNDNEDLPNATVSLNNLKTVTNNSGGFSFTAKPGAYTLTVTYVGYKKAEQPIRIERGQTKTIDIVLTSNEQMGEVVVVGSRSATPRSNLNTPVPADVFSPKQLVQTGQIKLTQMLNFAAPSLNASRELYNEPITLRGLDPDDVLILLNGTRYHNGAEYFGGFLKGTLGKGSVVNDLNSIPFSAIEKVEILRDGASAQYGSDAIAGVINFRLKESTGKTSILLHTGQYYAGDGEKFSFGINRGFSIRKKGFVNFSADYRYQLPIYHGGVYQGTVYTPYLDPGSHNDSIRIKATDDSIIKARSFNRSSVLGNTGSLKSVRAGVLMNGGYTLSNQTKVFWTASVNSRKVFRNTDYQFPEDSSEVNLDLYPDGFQPKDKESTTDVSAIIGIKSETKNDIGWELTSSYGQNRVSSSTTNDCNPSQSYLGKEAPTSFYDGKIIYQLLTNNINFSKAWRPAQIKSVNLAGGGEWRVENYRTEAGEEASWKDYDSTGNKSGGGGISPDNVINKSRNVFATYLDMETEFNDRFLLDAAARYEYYSDFGGNIAGKLSGRYKFSECFMLRASVNNGFRAPSLQQRYDISTFTGIDKNTGQVLFNGIFPNDNEVVRALGVSKLTAEKSINVSAGLTAKLNNRNSLTMDGYWIQIKNRIVLSGFYHRTNGGSIDSILKPFTNLNQIAQIQFFSNAINTRTFGIDLTLNGFYNFPKSTLYYTLAANLNRTNVFGKTQTPANIPADDENSNILFNRADKGSIEEGQPRDKIILTINYRLGKVGFVLNNTRFGRTTVFNRFTAALDEFYTPKILTDISINYKAKSWMTITVGANNVFNVYPDKLKYYRNSAQGIFIYNPEASPFGFYGGYYFVSMAFSF